MNCDRIARIYRYIEYLRFGRRLERCRSGMLQYAGASRKALVIGDGDGRFLSALARHNREIEIDAVDLSLRMVELSEKRLRTLPDSNGDRVRVLHGDIQNITPPRAPYDLIATHFLFDVFSDSGLPAVIERLSRWAAPDALWIVSEFDVPAAAWSRTNAHFWLRFMYAFFRLTTKLENQQLPAWRPLLQKAGFIRKQRRTFENGFIVSELWHRGDHASEP